MAIGALKLSPNYNTLSWFIDISYCGAHSTTSPKSLIKPFLVLGINGPTHPGQVYIHSLPYQDCKKIVVPINDPFLNRSMMAELSFKGLTQFSKDWKFTLVDTKTDKKKAVLSQEPILVRPGFNNTSAAFSNIHGIGNDNRNQEPKTRLELHIEIGADLRSVSFQQKN